MSMTIPIPSAGADGYRLLIDRTDWEGYVETLAELDRQGRRYRSTYCDGLLEIIVPGRTHEHLKKAIARMLEMYSFATDEIIEGLGSTTFKSELKKRGLEPDECFLIGRTVDDDPELIPDLAIEIDVSSSSIPREEVYAKLGVPELWRWRDDRLEVLRLARGKYKTVDRSVLLPRLPMDQFVRFVKMCLRESQSSVAKKWHQWLVANASK